MNRDVLGALWVDSREVFVDQSLDPEDRPWLEGRYRYTLGHEVGHWQLHCDQLGVSTGQGSLFSREPESTIICRKSQAKERIEWQADYFASTLLMPRTLVMAAWQQGWHASPTTISVILCKQLKYRLHGLKKTKEGATQHPDRDAQFHYLSEQCHAFQRRGQPVISVDAKKKELIGEFKNGGREWHPQGQPERWPARGHGPHRGSPPWSNSPRDRRIQTSDPLSSSSGPRLSMGPSTSRDLPE